MLTLPDTILPVLDPFASLFRDPTWRKAPQILLVAQRHIGHRPGVVSALRVMGLSSDHLAQQPSTGPWSPLEMPRILLELLIRHLDRGERGPLIFGIDDDP